MIEHRLKVKIDFIKKSFKNVVVFIFVRKKVWSNELYK